MLPADMDGYVTPPAGAPAPIVQFEADEFGNGQVDSIRLLDFHVDFTTPANSTLTEHAGSPLSVAAFDPREVPSGSRNVVPQPAGSALDAISDRLMFRLAYRNFGTHESLAMNHTVNAAVNPLFRAGVRYYEVRKTSLAGAWAVQEQATMAGAVGDLENRWMGSTALNLAGSQAVAYSVSSATTFTSVRYAGRLASDPAGSLAQGEATMVAGAGAQTSTSGRWGDYSDLTVDPLDDCTFWYTQEYYSATSGANWNTRIGSFQFGPCPAIQKGVLSGTVTSAATGNPITNATVLASNGFSRASAANGVYSIDPMASGTVSLTTSATNYLTANTPGVVVTTGNTTTQNIALTPLNSIVAGTGSVASDSCNSNATLDPNETVTVNLAISNVGGDGATTTNLTGTLQATGGVTSPSGPQNYGAVVSGGPAVSKSFTFTVGATCGGTVTATLSLQDGATNYGTLTYTFQVGQLTGTFPSTGGIAVAIPDNTAAGVDIPITVVGGPTISDVNVRVRINHTFDADLNISLVHPDGTSVALSTARGSSGDNFGTGANDCSGTPTVFDDAASTTIALGSPPYAGSFKPEAALSAFNGKTSNGTWKLHVVDTANLDTGTVGCVTLEINRAYSCCGVELAPGNAPAYSVAAESVSPANNALDPDETVTVNFFLKNVGGSNATNVVATLQPGGGVSAPSGPQSYGALTSLGPAVSKPFTFAVNGSCGGTVTATLALQDGATTLAPIQFTIPIGATSAVTQSFSNPTPIVIPATGTGASTGSPATPYPSNITVSGMSGVISKVTVTIPSISHTFPSDVDMLLVGPGGQKYIFLSDVIGGTDWVNISYTLDDAAAGLVPSSGTPASGTFKPTNYGTGDAFPSPAPASPYDNAATAGTATFASVFNGASPNGTWSLYVVDDAGTDIGTMATGWTLNITAQGQTCNTQACTINVPPNITTTATGPSGAVVNYTVPTCTGACGAVTSSPASGSTFPIGTTTVTVTGTRADNSTTTNTFTVTVTPNGSNGNLLISEFRLRGPGGTSDEFIEVYNNTNTPHTVSSSGGSAGYAIVAFDGTSATLKCTIPNGTVIPARGHYLCVNSAGYSLSGYPSGSPGGGVTPAPDEDIITVGEEDGGGGGDPKAPPSTATGDATYTADTPDNAAITLFNNSLAANWTAANRLDAVAPASISDALYKEGTGLPALTAGNVEGSWVRRLAGGCAGSMSGFHNHDCTTATLVNNTLPAVSGFPQDTGDNSADFIFVEANGTAGAAGSNQRLGGPGPENLASPLVRMSPSGAGTITASLIDSCTSSGNPPNRERTGSGNSGTLAIRRRFTNYTGATVTRLRFRVMDISTSPVLSGGGIADLRAVTSSDAVVSITCGGSTTVRGVTLESLPTQTGGGGFNSSLSAGIISTTPLAPGATVDINFLFNIFEAGKFRAFIIVEALP
jgi:subtilisin-like proprotein convertase family protein